MIKNQIYLDGQEFRESWSRFIKDQKTYIGSIPLLEDTKLSCQARILFQIISSISVKMGYCKAVNNTLSEKLGVKETMVKKYLRELEKAELIVTQLANLRGLKRRIFVNFETLRSRYQVDPDRVSANVKQTETELWVGVREFATKKEKYTAAGVKQSLANKKK
ncbi:MAG TPA: hypothetical protein VHA56_14450 [Mucilaginibacter sp.]|nr:hypothetical protein [Mucilaginibacter sp.]